MQNTSRNLTEDLIEGASDGAIKKIAPDRGGAVERDTVERRNGILQDVYYDLWPGSGQSAKYDYTQDTVSR
jgi:hypothetical protein